MQVLEDFIEYDPVEQLGNILNQKALPLFDKTRVNTKPTDKLLSSEIRFLSEFNELVKRIRMESEDDDVENDEDVEDEGLDDLEKEDGRREFMRIPSAISEQMAEPIITNLAMTCQDAMEEYKNWRTPQFSTRRKVISMIQKTNTKFATDKTKIYARDIGILVSKLISLGVQREDTFTIESFSGGNVVKRTYKDIILEIENARQEVAPELLFELLVSVMGVLPRDATYEEIHIISPSIPDVANIKERS